MKTHHLYKQLQNAVDKLKEAQSFEKTEPLREATIQRFEYTFELAWKLISSIAHDQGIEVYGIKNVIRDGAKLGLIDDTAKWFKYALARNKSSHGYKEEIAIEVYKVATGDFVDAVNNLLYKTIEYKNYE